MNLITTSRCFSVINNSKKRLIKPKQLRLRTNACRRKETTTKTTNTRGKNFTEEQVTAIYSFAKKFRNRRLKKCYLEKLVLETGLTKSQIGNWIRHYRQRYVKPKRKSFKFLGYQL